MTTTVLAPQAPATLILAGSIDSPQAVIVLVSPADAIGQCTNAVDRARLAGALTFTCEVDTEEPWLDAIDHVLAAVDDVVALFPELPVVLVGHDHAGPIAVLAGEACRDAISGVVLTKSHDTVNWAA